MCVKAPRKSLKEFFGNGNITFVRTYKFAGRFSENFWVGEDQYAIYAIVELKLKLINWSLDFWFVCKLRITIKIF